MSATTVEEIAIARECLEGAIAYLDKLQLGEIAVHACCALDLLNARFAPPGGVLLPELDTIAHAADAFFANDGTVAQPNV